MGPHGSNGMGGSCAYPMYLTRAPLIFDMTTGDEDLVTIAEDDSDSDGSDTEKEAQEEVILRSERGDTLMKPAALGCI